MSYDKMDLKIAAQAVRDVSIWKARALDAETKVAAYQRKEKVAELIKKAEHKQAALPKNVDLMKCSEETLQQLNQSLDMITTAGALQLGAPEDADEGTSTGSVQSEAQKAAQDLRQFTLSGMNS